MAAATAIAFGAGMSHADWTPIAAIVAMKASLDETTVVGAQRAAGALIGAAAAALLLLMAASASGGQTGVDQDRARNRRDRFPAPWGVDSVLELRVLHSGHRRGRADRRDLPHPSDYSAEADRVLWTLVGVAIALLVMLLGNLLAKRTAKARPQAAPPQPERGVAPVRGTAPRRLRPLAALPHSH